MRRDIPPSANVTARAHKANIRA